MSSYFYHKTKEFDGEDRIIFGGAERYLIELCRLLQDQGHKVTVVQPLPMNDPDKNYRNITKQYKGIDVLCLAVDGNWAYATNSEMNRAFNQISIMADLRIYFATFLSFPHIVNPAITISHGIFWDSPNHAYKHYNREQRDEFLRRQLYGFTAPDACVAVDTNVRNVVAAIEPGAESKTMVIPNFVDTDTFKPTDRQLNSDFKSRRPVILYPRRLDVGRGINHFIELTSHFPECDFLFCGNATEPEVEQQLAQWTKVYPNLNAIWRPMTKMEEVYQAADIAVVPTIASEGTSLSLLEAMATGLPVITTPVGGLPNLVINGWNGIVVDLNYERLALPLKMLLENPDLCKTFSERNRQMAVECFNLDLWRARWTNVINWVMR